MIKLSDPIQISPAPGTTRISKCILKSDAQKYLMTHSRTRVVLADDHARVRAGIRSLLESTPDIDVVGEAADGIEALRLVEQLEPDVLLLDVEMPRMTGNEVAAKLKENASPVRILALSAHDDSQYILGMLRNGASGYLMKEEVPDKLVKAVRGLANGEKDWVSSRVSQIIAARARTERMNRKTYTEREMNILRMLKAGKSREEIEKELGVNSWVMKTHLEMLFNKFEVSTVAELVHSAVHSGII
jgi:DNA-binding NarL/FixJ family response regulator